MASFTGLIQKIRTERVFSRADVLIYSALTSAGFLVIAYFVAAFATAKVWVADPLGSVLLFALFCLIAGSSLGRWAMLPLMRRPLPIAPEKGLRVAALTTFVPGAEPLEMLEHTLRALAAMQYPHDCWLLDEGNDSPAKALCAELGVHHFSRCDLADYQQKTGRFQSRTKYGNYNSWLDRIGFAAYDVVAAFDVDHVPCPAFLTETLGFFRDPEVGYVQTPQAYYNQSATFVAAGASEETYEFYSSIQMAAFGGGYPVVIGAHNVHRVTALAEVGGFAAHDADDLLITMLYRRARWRGVYVPKILARGIAPVNWSSYLTQQRRWTRSLCDLKFRRQHGYAAALPVRERFLSYLQGATYLQPALAFVLGLALLLNAVARGHIPFALLSAGAFRVASVVLMLSACFIFRQKFLLDAQEHGLHWRSRAMRMAKAPFLLLGMLDVLLDKRFDYVMTNKSNARRPGLILLPVYAPLASILLLGWIYGVCVNSAYPVFLHVVFAMSFAAIVALMASDFSVSPPPFEAKLLFRFWTGAVCYPESKSDP